MQRTPLKKVPPDPIPNTNEIDPFKPHPGWSSSLSQSSQDSSNSENRIMIVLGLISLSRIMDFKRSFLGAPKKGKKMSPIKSISPPPVQVSPSQKLGIYLKITPNTPFEITKITTIRVAIFKMLKSMFPLNIHRDGSLLIAVQDQKSADIILNLKSLLNTPINSSKWNPKQSPTKIVVYNVPLEIPIQRVKRRALR